MNKLIKILILFLLTAILIDCGSKKSSEADIKAFLVSTEGTFGWKTSAEPIMLDFFPDGGLHIQGPDGEATMWTGKWSLKGSELTMQREDLGKEVTVGVKIDGENLILGDKTYTRVKPQ
jgi:hypothetical protein